jgi:DNA-binding beta-propeller fold protein YncE
LPGSLIEAVVEGMRPPYDLSVIGPGGIVGGAYRVPDLDAGADATLVAANADAVAVRRLYLVPAPAPLRALIAVATYDGGIALHDPATFEPVGTLATGGAPSDVAFGTGGRIVATDTSGNALTVAGRTPWRITRIEDVPLGNEIAIDDATGAIFVSNRDVDGHGALTRAARDGTTARIVTGLTAEGLAIDGKRGIVYVGNVSDATVLAVDLHTMKPLRRIPAVPRVFGIALSPDGNVLYAVSNSSATSQFQQSGYVAAIALDGAHAHTIARSTDLQFPLGVALDARRNHLFVTDEAADTVYVLDSRTLRQAHPPLKTCKTPWKPLYDTASDRLFVPCARADKVDVFNGARLVRANGAPFATAGYPLAVAAWKPQ